MSHIEHLELLRRAPVLRRIPLGDLDRLLSRSQMVRFGPGDVLIEQGTPGQDVFVILAGRAAIRMRSGGWEEFVVALRSDGDWVGEMALLDQAPRSATVTAETEVRALRVPREAFLDVVTGHAEATLDLLRTVTRRLRESDAALIRALRAKNQELADTNRRLSRENRSLKSALDERFSLENYLGGSQAAHAVRAAGRRAAESNLPVLLLGETGTGKEHLARAIHAASERRGRPFVALNCALFTENLLESELFGHVRGAFTGAAAAKPGLVEAADGGTLFLDEVADMSRPIQASLLRFLELGEYRRLGETETRRADVRLIAATHEDLDAAVEEGRLRRDLLYRLDVFRVVLPPLRERREDLAELIDHCRREIAERLGVPPLELDPEVLDALCAYPFPGNVRELHNELERLYASRPAAARVSVGALSPKILRADPARAGSYADAVRAFKVQLIDDALRASGGNRSRAAARLGLHRSNLVRMIRDLGRAPGAGRARSPSLPGGAST